jgi:hypothetical protein
MTQRPEDSARTDPAGTPDFRTLDRSLLEGMLEAGHQIAECYRLLEKGGQNIVGEVLKGQGTFYEMDHYPSGDVYDNESHSQYYYHAHREGEHGHFHTFLREAGMPPGLAPVDQSHAEFMDDRDDTLSHLVAVSMDRAGFPISLFTTNRWVTADTWYAAPDVVQMLERFDMDLAFPSLPVNLWLTAMVRLFRPQIEALVHDRDRTIARWAVEHGDVDVFEDRELEVTSECAISVDSQLERVRAALSG